HFFASFGRVLRDFDRKAAMTRPHGLACYWHRADLVAELRRLWLATARGPIAASPAATDFVEKTPDHALWLDVVKELVPRARIVHVVRDSRAVCASLLAAGRAPWGAAWAPKSLDAAIGVWRDHVGAVLAGAPDAVVVRFEDLVQDPVSPMRALWNRLGLAAEDAALEEFRERVRAAPAAAFRGTGDITTTPPEPEGFLAAPGRSREALGWFARRRVWRMTADLMGRLGYDESGRTFP
ncbi:MAG: sulfotransferase family protein, partial [Phycisphaerales bacterium]